MYPRSEAWSLARAGEEKICIFFLPESRAYPISGDNVAMTDNSTYHCRPSTRSSNFLRRKTERSWPLRYPRPIIARNSVTLTHTPVIARYNDVCTSEKRSNFGLFNGKSLLPHCVSMRCVMCIRKYLADKVEIARD